jgi:hypothetical protein
MFELILAWVSSAVLGIGVVWKFVGMYKGKIRKAVRVAAETLDVLNSIIDAIDDKVITKAEIELIIDEVKQLQAVLK